MGCKAACLLSAAAIIAFTAAATAATAAVTTTAAAARRKGIAAVAVASTPLTEIMSITNGMGAGTLALSGEASARRKEKERLARPAERCPALLDELLRTVLLAFHSRVGSFASSH